MNNSEIIPTTQRKPRYDGRSKKRNWEERRSDKGANLDPTFPKLTKLNNETTTTTTEKKIKRLKFALLMGYSGVDYFGMQRNPNTKTVEEDLFKVLLDTNFIDQDSYNQVQNMQFQRAARTDKGVSAARQVVSLKLPENFDISIVNEKLCEQIRLFAFKRVTKGFNSKTQCDGRTYIYILPTVAFSENNSTNIISTQSEFRLPKEKFDEINEILNLYVGTKNFHNFTVKKKPQDPSAKRFIKSFICEDPFVKDGVEFCTLKVHGQSFMMHQIRKMVGLLLAVIRGMTTKETVDKSFSLEKVNVPKAPGLGLVLNYVHYDRYNYRYGEDGIHAKLTWDEVEKDIGEFKDKQILPTIINTEIKEESMLWWIQNKLIKHSYDDIQEEKMSDDEDDGEDEEITEELKNDTVALTVETRV